MSDWIILFYIPMCLLFFTDASAPSWQIVSPQVKNNGLLEAHSFDYITIIPLSITLLVLANAN